MSKRYFFHIWRGVRVAIDDVGQEFAALPEADNHGADLAKDIAGGDVDYGPGVVSVVDVHGNEVSRHRIERCLLC
ncbi:DUF6894 family protein [Bradyrhizobium sp.]|uniref:DUF6894 family protein n=1 Tax=Bradyrhizobium sp. TaxID=376 RepID=UPI0039E4C178